MLITNPFFHNNLFPFLSFSSIKYKTRQTSCAESLAVGWLNQVFHQSLDYSFSLFNLMHWLLSLQLHSEMCYLIHLLPTLVISSFFLFFKFSSIWYSIYSVLDWEWQNWGRQSKKSCPFFSATTAKAWGNKGSLCCALPTSDYADYSA